MIRPGEQADDQLHVLCAHVRDGWNDDGVTPDSVAVFSRPTDRGGYEVRFTAPLHQTMSRAAPSHYIEDCAPPRGWNKWTLRVGEEDWPKRLGIRTSE